MSGLQRRSPSAGGDRSGPRTVAFATCAAFPQGSPDDLLAIPALRDRGIEMVPAVWNDPSVDWSSFGMVIVRSTWDYTDRPVEFLEWIDRVDRATELWNPRELIRWNHHKGYLIELSRRGFRTVPTELLERGSGEPLDTVLGRRGWKTAVVKPAIGADGSGLFLVEAAGPAKSDRRSRELLERGDVLVQPYLARARELGERSLVLFRGRYTYAMEYPALLTRRDRRPRRVEPEPGLVAEAERAVASLPIRPLYARLDYLPGDEGGWLLSEMELIEPELLLRGDPAAPEAFAEAIAGSAPWSAGRSDL